MWYYHLSSNNLIKYNEFLDWTDVGDWFFTLKSHPLILSAAETFKLSLL